jgi:hypothetical protein
MNRWNFGKVTPCEFAVFLAVGQKYYLTKPRFKADFGSFCDPRQRTIFFIEINDLWRMPIK